jgi:alpha-beta hydrolase superfamily lysophospholipase
MQEEELSWNSHDGLRIFARSWAPTDGPARAVLCLVHGLGEHSGRYAAVAALLARRGYTLLAADTRGHGRSEGPRGHFPSIDAVLDDIGELLRQARERFPGRPLFLYGHSLGGVLALHYSLKRQPALHGVVVTSPALLTALEQQPAKVLAARLLGTLLPSLLLASGLDPTAISRQADVVQAYTSDPLVHDRVSLGFGKIMLEVSAWTRAHAREFSLPLLVLHGQADSIAYAAGSQDLVLALRPELGTLHLWPQAYHELHHEPEREQVLGTLTDWLDQQLLLQ